MLIAWSMRLVLPFVAIASPYTYPEVSVSQSNTQLNRNTTSQLASSQISPYAVSPLKAAQKSLGILQNRTIQSLISKNRVEARAYARDLGFESEDTVQLARLGSEIKVKTVKLQKLKTFKVDDKPRDYLIDARESIFAMSVNGLPQSSVTVAERKEKNKEEPWRWVKRGSGQEIKKIEQLKEDTQADFILKIPGFGKFLADETFDKLVLIPIYKGKVGNLKLHAGEKIDANLLFIELASIVAEAERTGKQRGGALLH